MEVNNFLRYNDNLKVHFNKIDTIIYDDITDMLAVGNNKETSTVLFNDYKGEVDSYYFSSSSIFTGNFCSIYRKTHSQPYFDYVCTLRNKISLIDFNIHNNDFYEYMAVVSLPKSDGTYSYSLYENKDAQDAIIYSQTNWGDWSICNIEETTEENTYTKVGDTWILGLNLNDENLTQNLSVTKWDSLGQFPQISYGQLDYHSGSFTSLLGRMGEVTSNAHEEVKEYRYTERENLTENYTSADGTSMRREFSDDKYSREMEKLLNWKKFCNDGALKLLKDIKGNAWVVQITESPSYNINTISISLPTTITFAWAEVLDLNEITIIN